MRSPTVTALCPVCCEVAVFIPVGPHRCTCSSCDALVKNHEVDYEPEVEEDA